MINTSVGAYQSASSAHTSSSAIQREDGPNGVVRTQRTQRTQRDEANLLIMQASTEVSLKAGNQSQALLLRSAIERINEILAPELGPDAISARMSEDNSPEATAERILSLSTGFFDSYAKQHPNDDPDQLATDFVNLIRGGFEKGFNEAKDILQGLKVFSGDVESGIMKTFELVSQGYDEFLAGKLGNDQASGLVS